MKKIKIALFAIVTVLATVLVFTACTGRRDAQDAKIAELSAQLEALQAERQATADEEAETSSRREGGRRRNRAEVDAEIARVQEQLQTAGAQTANTPRTGRVPSADETPEHPLPPGLHEEINAPATTATMSPRTSTTTTATAPAVSTTTTTTTQAPTASTARAPTASAGGFTASGGTITAYTGTSRQLVIPETVGGIRITEIRGPGLYDGIYQVSPFRGKQLTSVTIPNSVTSIVESAFVENQLTSITIPNSVTTIGQNAFAFNQLTSVTIGNSVTTIGSSAFQVNQLTSVTIPDSVTSIGRDAFANNPLTSISLTARQTAMISGIFGNVAQLTSVTIRNGGDTIAPDSFRNQNITSVVIPDSVRIIGENAFRGTPITRVTIGANVEVWWYTFGYDSSFKEFYEANGKQAGTYTRPNAESTAWSKQ